MARPAPRTVYGVHARAPRLTRGGLWLLVGRIGLPLLLALAAFDLVVWAAARLLFDRCAALWCWL